MFKHIIKIAIFIAVLMAAFTVYNAITDIPVVRLKPENGMADLTGIDFARDKVFVQGRNWEYYGLELYTPEDFANGAGTTPVIADTAGAPDDYGTHRVTLRLPKGKTYGIYGWSMLTSMRLYINGSLALEVGSPGESKEATTPGSHYYFYAFTPETDTTELIYHVANFHTSDGAGRYSFYIADFSRLHHDANRALFAVSIMAGCLVAAFFFYLGMFIFAPGKRSFIYFAVSCLIMAVRFMIMDDKQLIALFPKIPWSVGFAAEYLSVTLLLALFTLYFNELFPKLYHKIYTGVVLAVCAAYSAIILLTEAIFYSRFMPYFQAFMVLCAVVSGVLLTICFIKTKPKLLSDVMLLFGVLCIAAASVNDILYAIFQISLDGLMLPRAMALCIMVHVVALALDFMRSETELMNAQLTKQQLALEKAALERTNRLEKDMMATIAHETRTPLAVLTGYAELISMELERKGADEQTITDLKKISTETHRLANLMERMQKMSRDRISAGDKMKLDATAVIRQTAEMYAHILARKNTRLKIDISEDLPPVTAGPDEFTQILFNLLQNAAKYAENGEVGISAAQEDGMVAIAISDDGEGVSRELLPRVFERGVSGGNEGSGLGLSICKEIIEACGGSIELTSEPGQGTTVRFTLPVWNGGDSNA